MKYPGYVTDTPYPGHFHRETAPAWLHAVATALGRRAADPARAFAWCELGCGDGLNALLLAAACPNGRFVAVDFNPAHIEHGREVATAAGLDNLSFVHADFADFATGDHGYFDYIVCHGVWSWIAPVTREALLATAARRLAPGGLLYLGYMSHPGASPVAGLQQLLHRHAATTAGDSPTRAAAALTWLRRLADAGLGSIAEHPGLHRQLDALAREPPAQIAHEFLTTHWQPQHAGDMIQRLAGIGLDYVGSATPLENIDNVSLPGAVQPLIDAIADTALRESAKDAARSQSLRRDLYQRGGSAMSPPEHRAALDALRLAALPGAPTGGGLTLDTRIGPVPAPAELFGPALTALATGTKTFAELARLPAYAGRAGALNIAVQTLLWAGYAHPWHGDMPVDACRRLNARLDADRGDRPLRWRAAAGYGTALTTASR